MNHNYFLRRKNGKIFVFIKLFNCTVQHITSRNRSLNGVAVAIPKSATATRDRSQTGTNFFFFNIDNKNILSAPFFNVVLLITNKNFHHNIANYS